MNPTSEADPFEALVSTGVTAQGMDPSAEPTVVGLPDDEDRLLQEQGRGAGSVQAEPAAEVPSPDSAAESATGPQPGESAGASAGEPSSAATAAVPHGPSTIELPAVDARATPSRGPSTIELPAAAPPVPSASRTQIDPRLAPTRTGWALGAPEPEPEPSGLRNRHGLMVVGGVLALALAVAGVVAFTRPAPPAPEPSPAPQSSAAPSEEEALPPLTHQTVTPQPQVTEGARRAAVPKSSPVVRTRRVNRASDALNSGDLAGWPGDKTPLPPRAPHDREPLKRPSF